MLVLRTIMRFLRDAEYRFLLMTTGVVLLIGTFMYHYLEGWEYIDALYFSVITLSTIGYGDLAPVTTEGKLFTIFYIIIGIGIILSFINTVYEHSNEMRNKRRSNQ